MRQILQNLKSGETELVDIPSPKNLPGNLLIESQISLISAGTEKMLLNFGKANYLSKMKQQPDKVKEVVSKISSDGILQTVEAVRSKLDQPIPLGYCNSGIVTDSHSNFFNIGDRVVSNGAHADIVRVPENLCAKIPENVSDESAAFTVMGSIALQGIRLISPNIGETVVVSGLGLIGLLAVQILKANGCRVMGIDYDADKCNLAKKFGAETVNLSKNQDPIKVAKAFSKGNGVDAVLITASSSSNEVVSQAANMLRQRGKIVLVGVVGLDLSREDFYKKEISFQVSCSYGPGRYDPNYEDHGNDYPLGFVRWTEQRNFEAILEMLSDKSLNVEPLISHRFNFYKALEAYDSLDDPKTLGVLLNYGDSDEVKINTEIKLKPIHASKPVSGIVAGFYGAGNYASRTLIPAFKKSGVRLETLVTSSGLNSHVHGSKNGFSVASTSNKSILDNENINLVVIATRHNLHARQIIEALQANKNVFVEKPLAITLDEINAIEHTYENLLPKPALMIGFNRRFSSHSIKIKELIDNEPGAKAYVMTVSPGEVEKNHWVNDTSIGGGRIIGEVCHFVDLLRFLVGHEIVDYAAKKVSTELDAFNSNDILSITLSFKDGSIATIHYLANGGRVFPKERLEIFSNSAVLQLNDFKELKGYGWKNFKRKTTFFQDKGQAKCVESFISSIKSDAGELIPFKEIIEVAKICIKISDFVRSS